MYAGPFCTMLLKELGAEVIKVEFRGSGDAVRASPPITEGGEGYIFIILNRGKKAITLDLRADEGREIAGKLIKKADILVENFTLGVMDKLGLSYEKVSKANPKLIYASLSGFGQTGPYRSQPAFGLIAQAMGGWMSITGFPDDPPTKTGPSLADFMGALYAATSILAALQYRHKTGEGQEIDISLQDCVWATTAVEFSPPYFLRGEVPQRLGNGLPDVVPWGTYPAKDGYVALPIPLAGQWETFVKLAGREDLLRDPESMTLKERVKHRSETDAIVSEWTKERMVAEVLKEMSKVHLPCAPIPTIDKVVNDPQLLSRGMITEVEQTISGKLKVPGSVFKLSKTPGDPMAPAPFLGQHNYEVYSALLGYSEEEIKKLQDEGVI